MAGYRRLELLETGKGQRRGRGRWRARGRGRPDGTPCSVQLMTTDEGLVAIGNENWDWECYNLQFIKKCDHLLLRTRPHLLLTSTITATIMTEHDNMHSHPLHNYIHIYNLHSLLFYLFFFLACLLASVWCLFWFFSVNGCGFVCGWRTRYVRVWMSGCKRLG